MKGTHLLLTSQTSCRVMLIGIVFSVLHTAGILVSAYLMTERLLEPDLPEKPVFHVCTEALFCPFYRILNGLNGIAVQLLGSGKNFLASSSSLIFLMRDFERSDLIPMRNPDLLGFANLVFTVFENH